MFSTVLLPQRLSVSCDSDNFASIAYMDLKVKLNRKSHILGLFLGFSIGLKNFLPPKLKYGSSRCFSPGSFAVFSGAAHFNSAQYEPPPFRIFAGGFPRRRRRRNAFGLIQEYCITSENKTYFFSAISLATRDLRRAAVAFLIIPRLAALSIAL